MTMTYGEKLAYQRGYNRAVANSSDRIRRAVKIGRAYRARGALASEAERRCEACARWTRGGLGCAWGKCSADFEGELEARMWADQPTDIITSADFGCVNWLPNEGRNI